MEFNNEMLELARQARGLTQKELTEKCGLTQGAISHFERSLRTPSPETINKIAEALNFPKDFFYQKYEFQPLPITIDEGNFRKKNIKKQDLEKTLAWFNIYSFNLLSAKNLIFRKYEVFKNINIKVPPSCVANEVRKALNIPRGPITNLVKILEDIGIIIISCDLGTEKIDGFSYILEGQPIIFLTKNVTGDREKFTLAHELGHILLHYGDSIEYKDNKTIEKEANEFASEFLMPKVDIESSLKYLNLEKLFALKAKWKVSIQALLTRANSLKTISTDTYRFMYMNINKRGYRKIEPYPIEFEKPRSLIDLIRDKDKNFNFKEKFCISDEDLKTLYS